MDIYVLPSHNNCDKCGRLVPETNDVVFFCIQLGDLLAVAASSRHLLPVTEDGILVCEGSPSRAQYLKGQTRDVRGEYPYHPERERVCREAYAKMLAAVEVPIRH